MFNRPISKITKGSVLLALQKFLDVDVDVRVDMSTVSADMIERAAWESGLVLKSYRYHSYDPLNSIYIFTASADRMADLIQAEAASEIKKLLPKAEIISRNETREIRGISEIRDAVKDLHNTGRNYDDSVDDKV